MTVYLAGPMRGYPLWNFPAFDAAAASLRAQGFDVISPAELDRECGFSEYTTVLPEGFMEAAMRRDVEALLRVDAIVLMPGWEASTGAKFELLVAKNLGLKVMLLGESE